VIGETQKLMKQIYEYDYMFDADDNKRLKSMTLEDIDILQNIEEQQIDNIVDALMKSKNYAINPIKKFEEKQRHI
jgi:hypothetical protein